MKPLRFATLLAAALALTVGAAGQQATAITTAGQPAELDVRVAGPNSLRVTLKPLIEPGAPTGATDVVRSRSVRVALPDGRVRDVTYNGRRAAVTF